MSDSDGELNVKGLGQILPYLWIGTADTASDKDVLKGHKFNVIVNCASEDVDNFYPNDYTYHTFPIEGMWCMSTHYTVTRLHCTATVY